MNHSAEFRRCLEQIDIVGIKRLWNHISPHLPQPRSDEEALATIHLARTATRSIALKLRAYSHRWLSERNLPSNLPDELRPSAERMYPKVSAAVGISVNFKSEWLRPAAEEIRGAMEYVVHEAHADGKLEDTTFVKGRMLEAKTKTIRKLLGAIRIP